MGLWKFVRALSFEIPLARLPGSDFGQSSTSDIQQETNESLRIAVILENLVVLVTILAKVF